jgi:hypothetical protein
MGAILTVDIILERLPYRRKSGIKTSLFFSAKKYGDC